jgi:hypothetical protein
MDALNFVSTFLFQIGSRHVDFNLTDAQKALVKHPMVQGLLLFIMFYTTTRSVTYATIMLVGFYLVMRVWFNETSTYNLLPRNIRKAHGLDAARDDPTRLYYENMARLRV